MVRDLRYIHSHEIRILFETAKDAQKIIKIIGFISKGSAFPNEEKIFLGKCPVCRWRDDFRKSCNGE